MALQTSFTSYIIAKPSLREKSSKLLKELESLKLENPSFWEDDNLMMWCSMSEGWDHWDERLSRLGLETSVTKNGEHFAGDRVIDGIIGMSETVEWLERQGRVVWYRGAAPGRVYGHMLSKRGEDFFPAEEIAC
jgi:hypothetical protein